jgi:hypothetical protein
MAKARSISGLAHCRLGLWRRRTLQHEGCIAMLVVSIILEAAVAIIAVLAARKGKPYRYGLAFTFGAYVLYDLARLMQWNVEGGLLSWLFPLATVTALIAVWGLYRK